MMLPQQPIATTWENVADSSPRVRCSFCDRAVPLTEAGKWVPLTGSVNVCDRCRFMPAPATRIIAAASGIS